MASGTVRVYHVDHGYGMITPDETGPELYVYFDSIVGEGRRELAAGQRVEYDATEQEGRAVAERVRLAGEGQTA